MLGAQQIIRLQVPGPNALAASAHNISRGSTNTDSIEISMWSTDTTLEPQLAISPIVASGNSSVDQQVMDQFTQIRSMLSSFLRQKQETTHTAFCIRDGGIRRESGCEERGCEAS